jgi:hypothetical protein
MAVLTSKVTEADIIVVNIVKKLINKVLQYVPYLDMVDLLSQNILRTYFRGKLTASTLMPNPLYLKK